MRERQFRKTYRDAQRGREGQVGERLMVLLERRLDNVVYRLGLATTRAQARQFVNHGHVQVNGRRVDIPSFSSRATSSRSGRAARSGRRPWRPPTWWAACALAARGPRRAVGPRGASAGARRDLGPADEKLIIEFYAK